MTELTFALLKYGFLVLLWAFAWFAVRSLYRDIASFSPRPSRTRRRKSRRALKAASAPAAPIMAESRRPGISARNDQALDEAPTLLVIIDGPLAGSSVPLGNEAITLGRAASNTVVLDDEFVSSQTAHPANGSSKISAPRTAPSWANSVSARRRCCMPAYPCASAPPHSS